MKQGIENVPNDMGNMVKSAADKLGSFFGGAENEGRQAEQGVQNDYNQASNDVNQFGQSVQNDYNNASNDVNNFNQGVQNSYDQGEQQGRQQGW